MAFNKEILPKREFFKAPPRIVEPVSPPYLYRELYSNILMGFQQAYQMFRNEAEFINNLKVKINAEYSLKPNEGSMDLIVEEPSMQDAIWRVRFKGTKLEEGIIPKDPRLLTIAHETMVGKYLPIYPADTVHPAVEGLDQSTINYFNTLQKTFREYLRKR